MSPELLTSGTSAVPDVFPAALDKILRRHVWGAMGVGLIPVPVVDIAALTGIQLNLLRKLGNLYNMTFTEQTATKIISSLLSSVVPRTLGAAFAISLTKIIPALGQTLGVVTMPLAFGGATYALGKVFIQHFESGGTFLTFDPEKVKAYYAAMFQEGKKLAAAMQTRQVEQPQPVEYAEQPTEQTEPPTEHAEQPAEQIAQPISFEQEESQTMEPSAGQSEDQELEKASEIQDSDAPEAQEPETSSKKERRRKSSQPK